MRQDSSSTTNRRYLSIVVPFYNEEETIASLLTEILTVLEALDADSEIIAVNDGSTDRTAEILHDWETRHPHLRVITFEKNSGQGAALLTGLQAAKGETIVTLDGDGQNVPADIPRLLEQLRDSDLVVGIREGRCDTRLRKWMSKIANAVRSRLLGDGVSDSGCALKAMRRETVGALIPMQTLYSFVPALVAGGGFRVSEVAVTHRERQGGTSHYSLRKMLWRPLVDMLGVCWFNKRRSNPQAATSARFAPAMTAFAIAAAFFLFLGKHGLLEPDEGRYAEVAREMFESGDLVTPTLNGLSHVEKPPVIYWFTALSYRIFGVSEFSARLPSALAGMGIILLTFQIGKQLGGRRAGWLAALVLASSLQFFFMARLLTPDMMMAFWITAAVACAVKHHFHPDASACRWLFFVFMGIGFLTKGPMALVVPISAAIGLGWKADKNRRRLPWLRGMPLCIAIAFSWFLVVSIQNPSLFEYFLKTELRDRFLSSNHGRHQPFWFFLPILAAGFLPWSFFLVPAAMKRLRRPRTLGASSRFLLLWIAVPFLVLSLSGSKLVTYVLPLFPALAIAMALGLSNGLPTGRATMRLLGCTAIALATTLFLWPHLASEQFRFHVSLVSVLVIATSGGVLVFASSGNSSHSTNQYSPRRLAICSVMICLAIASQVDRVPHLLGRQASMREIAATLKQQPGYADARIIATNIRAHGLEFYLTRTVDVTRGQADLVLPAADDQQRRLHRSARMVSRVRELSSKPTFAVTRQPDWRKYFEPSGRWNTIGRSGDFFLLQLVEGEESLASK